MLHFFNLIVSLNIALTFTAHLNMDSADACVGTREDRQTDWTRFASQIKENGPSFLDEAAVPQREGPRPETLRCLPHSQLSQNAPEPYWQGIVILFFAIFLSHHLFQNFARVYLPRGLLLL